MYLSNGLGIGYFLICFGKWVRMNDSSRLRLRVMAIVMRNAITAEDVGMS